MYTKTNIRPGRQKLALKQMQQSSLYNIQPMIISSSKIIHST